MSQELIELSEEEEEDEEEIEEELKEELAEEVSEAFDEVVVEEEEEEEEELSTSEVLDKLSFEAAGVSKYCDQKGLDPGLAVTSIPEETDEGSVIHALSEREEALDAFEEAHEDAYAIEAQLIEAPDEETRDEIIQDFADTVRRSKEELLRDE